MSQVHATRNAMRAALPVKQPGTSRYGNWRAATLAGVYVLMALHIAHWKINGRTRAPLELNEVMYTLELGIVTAGFLFMAVARLTTLLFGRFFCGWGCHILALEDLCAWLLKKFHIRPQTRAAQARGCSYERRKFQPTPARLGLELAARTRSMGFRNRASACLHFRGRA